jgi:deoxyribodipyrimidine photo-lyase
MYHVPDIRYRKANRAGFNVDGAYVLYWMTGFRRTEWNFSLQRAIEWACDLQKPLIVCEPLSCSGPWSSERLHQFALQGMRDNEHRLKSTPVSYYPYIERTSGMSQDLFAALAQSSCVVIRDDFPCFPLAPTISHAAEQLPVLLEMVDSNGLLPLRAADKVYMRAYDFRRFLQKVLRTHLEHLPEADPLQAAQFPRLEQIPEHIRDNWPAADLAKWVSNTHFLSQLPIDHSIATVSGVRGGSIAGREMLQRFMQARLGEYDVNRNHPDEQATSRLSAYLHFGHLSAHCVFAEVMKSQDWHLDDLATTVTGQSAGWWGVASTVESFLDQLITWRELGYNGCWQRSDFDQYESLPGWARQTLAQHANDPREHLFTLERFAGADTHDALWNAAQRQLVDTGYIHNYLRMVWGKKILEWSTSPQEALTTMIELNNKYALDGQNPNSYSGIFWCLGRYDRAWGPERPIFGKVRYMSSKNTLRKCRVRAYLKQFARAAT